MKLTNTIVVLITTVCCANAAKKQSWPAGFGGAKTEVYKTINDVNLRIHIFNPKGKSKKPRPAAVFFFGGGWKGGTPKQFEHQCRYLASREIVAMTAEYRTRNIHNTLAEFCVRDGKSAVRWVRANARRLGVDPDRIVAGGGSAGGHVAACTGSIEGFEDESTPSSLPNAMVLFNPALVLAPIPGHKETIPETKVEELAERMGMHPSKLSPWHQLRKEAPPTLILHGKADNTVAYWTAEAFHKKMLKTGNRSVLLGFADQPHGFFNYGRKQNEMFIATMKETDRFLVSLGYLSGKDTLDSYVKAKRP